MIAAALLTLVTLAIPPLPKSYVTDPAGVLSDAKANHLEDQLHKFEDDTDDYVIVWIGKSTGSVPIDTWAEQVTAAWKIGHTDNDTGAAVLFVFTDTQRVQIVTTGDATDLTAARAAQIADRTIRPALAAGHADVAIQSGIDAMLREIDPPDDAPTAKPAPTATPASTKPAKAAALPAAQAVAAAAAIAQATRTSPPATSSSSAEGPLAAVRDRPPSSVPAAGDSQDDTGVVPIPPSPAYFVTDNANVLSASTRDQVEAELEAFARKTTDQVVVWIGESTGDTPLEEWTVKAAQSWGVGQRGKDNGVVLFVFMKDRKLRIEVGYGLEATLTDATAAQILSDSIEPAMRRGDPDAAVTSGVAGILHAIDADAPAPAKAPFNLFRAIGGVFAAIPSVFQSLPLWAGGIVLVVSCIAVGFWFLKFLGSFFAGLFDWAKTGKSDKLYDLFDSVSGGSSGGSIGDTSGPYWSGGGGGGGGGFSGGGGGFGGGGASGGW